MKKSAFISDILFSSFSVFLLTLCLFRYLGFGLWVSIFLAFVCGFLGAIAVGAWLTGKRNAFFLKKADERQKEKLLLHLALLSADGKTKLFMGALGTQSTAKRVAPLKIDTGEELIFLRFAFAPVTADEVAALSRWKSAKKKTVFCGEMEESAKRLCQRLGIRVQTGESVYQTLKECDGLPSEYLGEELPVDKKIRRKTTCFAKRNARRFFVSGLLVLLTSLFTPFPYYYLVFGSILLLAALFIRVFGYA
jgi:hypothetical protein